MATKKTTRTQKRRLILSILVLLCTTGLIVARTWSVIKHQQGTDHKITAVENVTPKPHIPWPQLSPVAGNDDSNRKKARTSTDEKEEIIDELPLDDSNPQESASPIPTPLKVAAQSMATPIETALEPVIAALQEAQNVPPIQQINQDLIGGVAVVHKDTGATTTIEPTITPTNSSALPLLTGQPRGYAMLYMMHPKARPVVDAEVQNLIDANVQQVYIGVLVDGTFTRDHDYLQSVLTKLSEAGRDVVLEQYLISGPTQRYWKTTPIRTDFSQLDPMNFRSWDIYQPEVQANIRKVAREAKASFEKNTALRPSNVNLVSVMLEDNLESVSYRYLRNLVSQEIGNAATFIRNACPDCGVEGSDADSAGDPLELHKVSDFQTLEKGDGYTLDGVKVTYPGDPSSGDLELEELRQMLKDSFSKGHRFFGLWRKSRQGAADNSRDNLAPDDRTYVVPTAEELQLEISLLREGLIEQNAS